jgi:thiopeptide-type bacteriocin biosynthesis protein
MKGDPATLVTTVLPALARAIEAEIQTGRAWKFQLDTYEREVARYGGPRAVELAEELFHVDSAAAVSILRAAPGDSGMDARWRLALAGVDRLFDDFALDLEAKRRLARRQRDAYALEFGAGTHLKKGIGTRFRESKDDLAALLRRDASGDPVVAEGLRVLDARSRSSEPVISRLRELDSAGDLSVPIDELAATFAHIWVNRVLRSAHRAQEYVIYDLLDRLYLAQRAVGAQAPKS